jgi:hypothetical protein
MSIKRRFKSWNQLICKKPPLLNTITSKCSAKHFLKLRATSQLLTWGKKIGDWCIIDRSSCRDPVISRNVSWFIAAHHFICIFVNLLEIRSVLVWGSLLTNKLMAQGFQLSRLQAAFRKFYGRYNDLICPYNLSLGHMLCDVFQPIVKTFLTHWSWLRFVPFIY